MTVTNEGSRIELTESPKGTFLESGSPKMSVDGGDLLKTLAQELGKPPNHMAISGQLDSKPYLPTAACTNCELSADRANATRPLMTPNGLREDQVTQVRGFTDQCLRKPAVPLDPINRRISLIVQYQERPSAKAGGTSEKPGEGQPNKEAIGEGEAAESKKEDTGANPGCGWTAEM